MDKKINFSFPITIFGQMEKYNDTISKARCRIFYKYGNRNRTYITDEVAEMLIASLPYAPVKGIYEEMDDDFTDHGEERQEGRIYGVVSGEPNLAWEEVEDDDGVVRTYATVDVLLYTALYKEANEIIGKPQSMELYPPATHGEWKKIDGKEYYVFSEAKFLGLQVLGDSVEPCFEGATFYSLFPEFYEQFSQLFDLIKKTKKEDNKMPIKFKLSDDEKYSLIWNLINPNFTEEGDWTVEYSICAIYDEYALVVSSETGKFERVYYTKSEDEVTLNSREECFVVDVNTSEKEALDSIRANNNGTYENSADTFQKGIQYDADIAAKDETISNLNTSLEEGQGTISTLTEERDTLSNSLSEANEQLETLKTYKKDIEDKEKTTILNKYSEKVGEEICSKYQKEIDNYTVVELDKALAYEYVQANEKEVFGLQNSGKLPKEVELEGLAAVLENYK